jgi:hypothetical protein
MLEELKLQVARAQLATALELFIREKDPISVQCLACGGSEVIEGVAELKGIEPFSTQALQEHPHLDTAKLRGIRNQYWNSFKHLRNRKGNIRDDTELLASFDDAKNDAALFIGWLDYQAITGTSPIAAQVFQVWWYALNENKLGPNSNLQAIRDAFPNIATAERAEQKRRLRRSVEKWRKDALLVSDPRTEPSLHHSWGEFAAAA